MTDKEFEKFDLMDKELRNYEYENLYDEAVRAREAEKRSERLCDKWNADYKKLYQDWTELGKENANLKAEKNKIIEFLKKLETYLKGLP